MTSEFETLQTKYNNLVVVTSEQAEYIEVADLKIDELENQLADLQLVVSMLQRGDNCEQ